MNKNTINTTNMPQVVEPPEPLQLNPNPLKNLKIFTVDHELALQVKDEAARITRQITVQEILREAIHEGLPAVQRRYRAAVDAAQKAD